MTTCHLRYPASSPTPPPAERPLHHSFLPFSPRLRSLMVWPFRKEPPFLPFSPCHGTVDPALLARLTLTQHLELRLCQTGTYVSLACSLPLLNRKGGTYTCISQRRPEHGLGEEGRLLRSRHAPRPACSPHISSAAWQAAGGACGHLAEQPQRGAEVAQQHSKRLLSGHLGLAGLAPLPLQCWGSQVLPPV